MTIQCDILVVDDESSITAVLTDVLSSDGYHVDAAHSGEEALELFAKGNYSVVISDIVMPGISGIDLLKKIKQINEDTQVLIMTSHAELKTSIEALRSDAYDYLTKPFENLDVISLAARRAAEKADLIQQNRVLFEDLNLKNENTIRMSEVLRELTMQDGLTGLYNNRHFHELLASEIERSKRYNHLFSLLFMAVDHFMKYNDTNGHIAGDKVLRELADLLKKNTRKSNAVARYGFEVFAIILPEISREEALVFAERVRAMIAGHPFPGRERQPGGLLSVSIGLSTFPHDGIDRKSLIGHAEQALQAAKKSGRNKVC